MVLSLAVSHSSAAVAPSTPRTEWDWTAWPVRPVDAPRPTETPTVAPEVIYEPATAPVPTRAPVRLPRAVAKPKKVLPVSGSNSGSRIVGLATYYAYVPGGAAAGPALRRALGPGWRGTVVTVCASGCVRVTLSDFCQCYKGTADERLIDLDSRAFAAILSLRRGKGQVSVHW